MADAEDLKSSGDFSSWGFDSPPGHHSKQGLPTHFQPLPFSFLGRDCTQFLCSISGMEDGGVEMFENLLVGR